MTETQTRRIQRHLNRGGSLTVLSALKKFGCMSLSQRISEMKRGGVRIDDKWVTLQNGKKIKRYFIER